MDYIVGVDEFWDKMCDPHSKLITDYKLELNGNTYRTSVSPVEIEGYIADRLHEIADDLNLL